MIVIEYHFISKGLVCDECGKKLSSKVSLTYHMRQHTKEKLFKCDSLGCDSSFTQKSQLESHRSECHPKTFKCDSNGCDFQSNNKYWFERHRLEKHNLESDDKTGSKVRTSKSKSPKRVFVCNWPECEEKFPQSSLLKEHKKYFFFCSKILIIFYEYQRICFSLSL